MRAFAAVLLLSSAIVGCAANTDPVVTGAIDKAGAAVRIESPDGIGSGVYIGNGIIITAAHVVEGQTTVKIKLDNGGERTGTVLWANKAYDIAAVQPNYPKRISAAPLSCTTPRVGEAVTAEGNPAGIEFITMRGFVSGKEREAPPMWKSVVVTDMTTIGGMSGGPTYNDAGEVVGITVGTLGFGGPAGGLGFVVPGAAVCKLLGREVVS